MAGRKYQELLRRDITTGTLGADGALPTLRQLAERYHCSLSTIRQAAEALRKEGLIYSVSGKGTFIGTPPVPPAAKRFRMVGVITLRYMNYSVVEDFKDEWQQRGWLICNYNAMNDLQAPAMEREFLLQASSCKFAGVVLTATPLEPLNTELYRKLQRNGMKIAHTVPYCDDMSKDCFFCCDYRAAGRLGVATALQQRCSQIAMLVNNVPAPFMSQTRSGVEEMTSGMQLPPPVTLRCPNWTADWEEDSEHVRCKFQELERLLPELEALPSRSALLCCGTDMAGKLRRLLSEKGLMQRKDFFIMSLNNGASNPAGEGGIYFDFAAATRAALEYVCDDTVDSHSLVQRNFAPEVRDIIPPPSI